MFQKILVPLDGSDLAAQVLPEVEELAKAFKSEITLITVGSLMAMIATANEFSYQGLDEFAAEMRKAAEGKLVNYAAKMKAKGLNVKHVYIEGNSAIEIIKYAAKNNYDLIALATHGKGEIAWVLGSVAEKVVSHSTVPVLLKRVLPIRQPVSKKDDEDMSTIDASEMPA
jgi:nucleotide-binding universal stress UspA family protein